MLSKQVRNLIIGLAIVLTLLCGSIIAKATGFVKPFKLSESNIVYVQKNIAAKEVLQRDYDVLLYHSHTHELYQDSNVILMGLDLQNKLEAKGLKVKVINDDFTKSDYNNSYYESRKMLKDELKNNNYRLIIDLHDDALPEGKVVTGTDNSGNAISKLMFVTTTENSNYQENRKCIDEIKGYIDEHGSDLTRKTWEYKKGISFYSQDLGNQNGDGNVILIENGFNTNSEIEVKRANTYLSSAIFRYLNNN